MLLFLNKKSTWPLYLEQLLTIPLMTAFFTVYRAALSDDLGSVNFAKANAKLGAFAGLGVITGPVLSVLISRRFEPRCVCVCWTEWMVSAGGCGCVGVCDSVCVCV
jgi:hypothetical protein